MQHEMPILQGSNIYSSNLQGYWAKLTNSPNPQPFLYALETDGTGAPGCLSQWGI